MGHPRIESKKRAARYTWPPDSRGGCPPMVHLALAKNGLRPSVF